MRGENLVLRPPYPRLELASLYVDQFPDNDLSRGFAKQYGFRLASSVAEALSAPVDGVLIIGEHGNYPQNEKGQELYPRKRFFDETIAALRKEQLRLSLSLSSAGHAERQSERGSAKALTNPINYG